jgi:glycosyltransferase involved in cell wall biosynthesis
MRIVIDMQGAQTESRYRGIGRYTLSITQEIVKHRGEHEIILVLSGLFPETIGPIRAVFKNLLPEENIRVWHAPGPVYQANPENDERRRVAELIREAFLESLQPDLIHIHSLFEGFGDNAVVSIGMYDRHTPVSATLYDLIPMLYPNQYLAPSPAFSDYYHKKLDQITRASLLLSISESSSNEAIDHLGISNEIVCNTSLAADAKFRRLNTRREDAISLTSKFGVSRPFVLYSGGADQRKNLPRLLEAYASLPAGVRSSHQLLFAGKMPQSNIVELRKIAKQVGLGKDELCFTGFVSDDELVSLYNLCKLFVFPTWHEGFGLPALEAMQCGAPVIGANTSSLPEVIGFEEALFDPLDVNSISRKIEQALSDEVFRKQLINHGEQQAKCFSWEVSAKRAIAAWEKHFDQRNRLSRDRSSAYSAPITLERAIIEKIETPNKLALSEIATDLALNQQAGFCRQLFIDVSEIRNTDAATGVQRVVRSYLQALLLNPPQGFQVIPVYATRDDSYCYDWNMLRAYGGGFSGDFPEDEVGGRTLIQWQRGDIFFGLDLQHHVQIAQAAFFRRLQADGVIVKFLVYDLLPIQLADLFKNDDAKLLHEQWLKMVAATDGAICISKATADAFDEWVERNEIYRTPGFRNSWVHIGGDLEGSKPSKGLPADADQVLEKIRQRPSFLAVSTIEPRKGQDLIFSAIESLWERGCDVNLVLVGKQGWKIDDLANKLRRHSENGRRLFWLEGISDEYLEKIYQASSVLVAASINEGFGLSLIEAARFNVPIIARDIPVFREVAQSNAFYFRGDTGELLADELQEWLALYSQAKHPLSSELSWQTWAESAEKVKSELIERHYPRRQLLVDISELVQRDARSGIQRVVRSILKEWLSNPPEGYRVEPVYGSVDDGYRYAKRFTLDFMSWPMAELEDELIDYAPGDVFLGLDMQPQVQVAQREFYQKLRRQGVKVKFVLYDLLPITMPQFFPPGNEEGFTRWLKVITETDGVICISRAVADELRAWIGEGNCSERDFPLEVDWFHLGADIENSAPSKGMPKDSSIILKKLRSKPSFMMVGTVEPRKGHSDTLDVFDLLWARALDVNLVIVGKAGWKVDKLVERIESHNEYNQRLFWLSGISDEYLNKVYDSADCLIASSYGEGFGLPLVEAKRKGLPVIARDIPVFQEVAANNTTFLPKDMDPVLSSEIILDWLNSGSSHRSDTSAVKSWLTWQESSVKLFEIL